MLVVLIAFRLLQATMTTSIRLLYSVLLIDSIQCKTIQLTAALSHCLGISRLDASLDELILLLKEVDNQVWYDAVACRHLNASLGSQARHSCVLQVRLP